MVYSYITFSWKSNKKLRTDIKISVTKSLSVHCSMKHIYNSKGKSESALCWMNELFMAPSCTKKGPGGLTHPDSDCDSTYRCGVWSDMYQYGSSSINYGNSSAGENAISHTILHFDYSIPLFYCTEQNCIGYILLFTLNHFMHQDYRFFFYKV